MASTNKLERLIVDLSEAHAWYMVHPEKDDDDVQGSWKFGFFLATVSKHPMYKPTGMSINTAMARFRILQEIKKHVPEQSLKRGKLYGHLAVVWHETTMDSNTHG